MKRYVLILLSLVLVTTGLIWGVASRPPVPTRIPASPVRTSVDKPNENVVLPPSALLNTRSPLAQTTTEETGLALPRISDVAKAKDRVRQLSTTFDEAHVAELASYLEHASADVRDAALEGLVLLGDSSAIPLIRATATLTESDPSKGAEAAALWSAVKVLSDAQKGGEPKMPKLPLNTASATIVRKPVEATAASPKR
jgi:hypothetical protein